jgi:PmbA protein
MSKQNIELAQWAVEKALKYGADQAAVSISNQREVEIEYREKQLDKLKESTQNGLGLSLYLNHRYSSHSTNDLRKNTLEKFIEEAVASTKYLSEDKYRELPDPSLYPKELKGDLQILDKNYDKITAEERKKIAEEIEAAAMAVSDKIISTTSGYVDVIYDVSRVNSNGFRGESRGTNFYTGAEVTVKDGDKGRPSDWYWPGTRFIDDLPSPELIGREAADRALRKIGQKKIKSGDYIMVVENRSGSRLLWMLKGAMQARALQQKNSFLEDMINKKITSEKLSMIDDPFLKKGMGSKFFDSEGIALKKRVMIENGILREYYVDNYYGKKLGMKPNSASSSNTVFKYGSRNLDEIIKDIPNGIFITSFLGGNSNGTTGDFSFGIVGQLIENGKMTQPVNEMNISGNAKELWKNLIEMGNDPYPYSSTRMPTLVFDGVSFSGL